MRSIGRALGYLSLIVHFALSLFLLGLGAIGLMAGQDMTIDLLPAEPESTASTLLILGIVGLASVALALRSGRAARTLLVLWSLAVCFVLGSAFFRSAYKFDGMEDFRAGVWIFLGAVLLFIGSWFRCKITPHNKPAA